MHPQRRAPGRAPRNDQWQVREVSQDLALLPQFNGTVSRGDEVSKLLRIAAERCNLVSPPALGALPSVITVVFNAWFVDTSKDSTDVYKVDGDRWMLSASALRRIGMNAAVRWHGTDRTDDQKDAHFCAMVARGSYMQFDGMWIPIEGHRAIDLRDDSAACREIFEQAKGKREAEERKAREEPGYRPYYPNPEARIRQMRMHLVARCETGAQCRALKMLGIRPFYRRDDFAKPFVVVRPSLSADDPRVTEAIIANFHGAQQAAYGESTRRSSTRVRVEDEDQPGRYAQHAPRAHAPAPKPAAPPPPKTTAATGWDDDEPETSPQSPQGQAKVSSRPPPPAATPGPVAAKPRHDPRVDPIEPNFRSGVVIPPYDRKEGGLAIEEASDEALVEWRDRKVRSLANPDKAKFHAEDREFVEAVDEELEFREQTRAQAPH